MARITRVPHWQAGTDVRHAAGLKTPLTILAPPIIEPVTTMDRANMMGLID